MIRCIVIAIFVCALCFSADSSDSYLRYIDHIAQKELDARETTIKAITTAQAADQRKAYVRAKILELIGGLPGYEGPLNPKITNEIRQPGFVIEKLTFESLPHVYVTANLYRPDRSGKFPGILLPLGHWEYGKPAVQNIAGNLALKGFVVLTYDPLGQGERQQFYDRRLDGSLAGGSTTQHTLAGGLSLLIGQSFARYRIWDAKRALDYLVSRPEVLTDRIGCTGCSGGGTLTSYISALDPRIKVAAPACYINSFRVLFAGPVGDSEQSLPRFLSSGLDIPDYIESFAPKPWLISSTQDDFFPIEGSRMAYEEAQRWYRMYGASDKIKRVVGPGGHGTPLVVREAIYEWMIRWLKDGDGSPKEQPISLLPEHALWSTPKGQVADLPGSREVFDVLRDDYHRLSHRAGRDELVAMLRTLIDVPSQAPAFQETSGRMLIETEPDLKITATMLTPQAPGPHPAVLMVDTRGSQPPQRAHDLVHDGNVVLVVTPRALPPGPDIRSFWGDWLPNVRALLVGRNLPAMRAHDILNGYQILKSRADVDANRISGEATGMAGIWLLMAAAVERGIGPVTVTQTPFSFADAFDHPLTRDLHSAVIPGFALKWELGDLVEPNRVSWVDPANWQGHVIPLRGSYTYAPADQ